MAPQDLRGSTTKRNEVIHFSQKKRERGILISPEPHTDKRRSPGTPGRDVGAPQGAGGAASFLSGH
ncbi:hypothetical protein EYF80_065556 [Liparis tanakae]|uniref:Uncharacterized protein n=1 Tax=Liparis tanakae TaxID=230148 RepID=A0A4Z2E6E3_9TELE|nr:hypothetical protein EYF80_065556 [Liparis tanakae]